MKETISATSEQDVAKQFSGSSTMDDADAFIEDRGTDFKATAAPAAHKPARAAKSLLKLREQLDAAFPRRSRSLDGIYGDNAHCPNPDGTGDSDHCPNIVDGDHRVVTALDATHDPDRGCDMDKVVEAIRMSRDVRIKYIIWNRQICNSRAIGNAEPWAWRSYAGRNPHDKHAHFSVLADKARYDAEAPWSIGAATSHGDV